MLDSLLPWQEQSGLAVQALFAPTRHVSRREYEKPRVNQQTLARPVPKNRSAQAKHFAQLPEGVKHRHRSRPRAMTYRVSGDPARNAETNSHRRVLEDRIKTEHIDVPRPTRLGLPCPSSESTQLSTRQAGQTTHAERVPETSGTSVCRTPPTNHREAAGGHKNKHP